MNKTIVCCFFLFFMLTTQAQNFLFKKNKHDSEGKMHGYWEMYNNNHIIFKGKYYHGKQIGTCKFYYANGTRYMKLRYINDTLARLKNTIYKGE